VTELKEERQRRKADIERREAFFDEAGRLTPYVSTRSETGELFFVRTSDTGIGKRVFAHGSRKDMKVLAQALDFARELGVELPAEPVLLEVGANIGTTTVSALRRHGFAAAIALEPSPANFRVLRLNLVANEVDDRVRVIQAAASDREGELRFDVSHHNSGTHRVPRPDAPPLGDDVITVQAVMLDALVDEGVIDPGRIGLIWIDAAGHEAHVLRGASKLLEAGVPLVTAIKHGWPQTVADVVEHLKRHYTDFAELRYVRTCRGIDELESVIEPLERSTDVLAVRR
jgi:FkbM family methyltransferase